MITVRSCLSRGAGRENPCWFSFKFPNYSPEWPPCRPLLYYLCILWACTLQSTSKALFFALTPKNNNKKLYKVFTWNFYTRLYFLCLYFYLPSWHLLFTNLYCSFFSFLYSCLMLIFFKNKKLEHKWKDQLQS